MHFQISISLSFHLGQTSRLTEDNKSNLIRISSEISGLLSFLMPFNLRHHIDYFFDVYDAEPG